MIMHHANDGNFVSERLERLNAGNLVQVDNIGRNGVDYLFERKRTFPVRDLRQFPAQENSIEQSLVAIEIRLSSSAESQMAFVTETSETLRGRGHVLFNASEVAAFLIYEKDSHEWPPRRDSQGDW